MHKLFEQVENGDSEGVVGKEIDIEDMIPQVLERKDLSKAGDLFSLDDSVIVDELSAVIKALQVE